MDQGGRGKYAQNELYKILKEQVKMREKKLQTKNKVEGDQGSSWVIEESSPYPFSHFLLLVRHDLYIKQLLTNFLYEFPRYSFIAPHSIWGETV